MKMIYLIAIFLVSSLAFSQNTIKERQKNQIKRISNGVKTGELNKKETLKSLKGQRKISKMKKKARKDGFVTKKERNKIRKAQKKESKKIYKRKHD